MKKRGHSFLLTFFLLTTAGYAQDVSAGPYFQQEVNYKIRVTLNDKDHELNAFEEIEYINNSPDTLHFLYFHLWPNAYSNNNTELAKQKEKINGKSKLFNDPQLKGYIDSLDFRTDEEPMQWELLPRLPDVCKLLLNQPLTPGSSIIITTPFHVKIPLGVTSRMGHIGQSYQISQWFPKSAVYDKEGWHPMPYLDQGEFYSEFGTFDVSITLPSNYVVGATGNLQNAEENEWLDKLSGDSSRMDIPKRKSTDFPLSSTKMKTLRYMESNIHDFAWFADKRFHVRKGRQRILGSNKEINTMVLFTDRQATLWKDALAYVNSAIEYFSKSIGEYPYGSFTAVHTALIAGDGMEYPGITVISDMKNAFSLDEVISHEIIHSWFYAALGFNERRYPYLDEGITSAFETRYIRMKYPEKKLWEGYLRKIKTARFFKFEKVPQHRVQELEWLIQARRNMEMPVNQSSEDYDPVNYAMMVYNKAAIGFNYLRAYLGDPVFDNVIKDFYHQWKFKHPAPADLRNSFESNTGKNLAWFFDDLLGTVKRLDYRLVKLANDSLLVENKGEMKSPLIIAGLNADSVVVEKWIEGFEGERWIKFPRGDLVTGIRIDPGHVMPEIDRMNNNMRVNGIFKRADPLRTQLFFTLEDNESHSLIYFPVANWNKENGFMLGVAAHNGLILPKRLEYFVLPFYSFNSSLAGFGKITYNITPYEKLFRMISITLEGSRFGAPGNQNYHKVQAGADLYFRSRINNQFRNRLSAYYTYASDLNEIITGEKAGMKSYWQMAYRFEKDALINPFSITTSLELNESYLKPSLEFNYKISYNGFKRGLDIRLFAGKMIRENTDIPFYAFAPAGRSGREMYLFQGTFFDRFKEFSAATLLSRQMSLTEGGLVSPVNSLLGYSNQLASLSFTSDLPGKAGIIQAKPFLNVLFNDHGAGPDNSSVFYEAGIKAGIWSLLEIYFPFFVSDNISAISKSLNERIRFVFRLDSVLQMKFKGGV